MTEYLFRDKTDEYDDRPKRSTASAERPEQTKYTPLPWVELILSWAKSNQLDKDAVIAAAGYALTACNNYEALKQSHAAMMDALKDMKSGWTYIREVYGDLYGVGWDRAEILAKEALANAKKIAEGL